jgi:hypothetical protein
MRLALFGSVGALSLSLGWLGCGDDSGTGGSGGSVADGGSGGATTTTTTTTTSGGQGGDGGQGGQGGAQPAASLVFHDYGLPIDLTPDGSSALLQDLASPTGDVYVVATMGGEPMLLTSVGDPLRDLATGMSATGAITALHGDPVEAGVFDGSWRDIASAFGAGCDQDNGAALDISADASVVVGMMWNGCAPQAFRWVDDGGAGTTTLLELLGAGPSTPTNRATVVSDDGEVTAGFASLMAVDRTPAVWTADGSGFLLDPANVDEPGEVLSISEDGGVLGGTWGNEAFVWTEALGRANLPRPEILLPSDPCYANAISAGGDLVFGGCGNPFFTTPIAVVWKDGEVQILADVLAANDLEVPAELALTTVLAASNDGSVLLGVALNANTFEQRSFVLRLPASAY